MSAWPEAVYIITEARKNLISADLLEKLKDRRNVIANVTYDHDNIIPESHGSERFTNESLWLITDGTTPSEVNYVLSVIDTKKELPGGDIEPSDKGNTDEYLTNSVWLILDKKDAEGGNDGETG